MDASFYLFWPKMLLLFSHQITSDSLWPHGLQPTRLPCPSLSPKVCSNSCPLNWWCHPTISSPVAPFSSCPHSFQVSWSFTMHQVAKVLELQLPINIQGWFLKLDWFDLLTVQGILKSLLQYHNLKASILWHSAFFMVQLSYPYMTTAITIALTLQSFVSKAKSLLLIHCLDLSNFLRSKCPLIPLLQSPSTVILEPKKKKICQFPLSPHLFAIKW